MENEWERETENMYGATSNGIGFGHVAPAANTQFPRAWTLK